MANYPLSNLSAQITPAGVYAPPFADIVLSLQASYQQIYGSDVALSEDTQDGQWIGVVSKLINDANLSAISTFNAFSPATAQGTGLHNVVKINGLMVNVASNSQVTVRLVGQAGTVITAGQVADVNGNVWSLPTTVTIPNTGQVDVTATAVQSGSIAASPGQVSVIRTPTRGWQTVTNLASASLGEPVESDPALRARQSRSVALPSLTVLAGAVAALEALPGVVEVAPYDNDTNATNADGIPAHSVAFVVNGGDSTAIAQTIDRKKGPGAGTFGTTSVVVVDSIGISKTINFFRPTNVSILVRLSITALTGYTTIIGDQARTAVSNYINSLVIGADVLRSRLFLPAQLFGGTGSETYELTNVELSIKPAALGTADIPIAINNKAVILLADVTLVVT